MFKAIAKKQESPEGFLTLDAEGDILSKDRNRNGLGEMALLATKEEMRFRLLDHPADPDADEDLLLDLQLFQKGK